MKKVSIQKLSLLGLVLIGASAITAWVMPKSKPAFRVNGVLQGGTQNGSRLQSTCKPGTGGVACDYTTTDVNTSATTNSGETSDDAATTGADNTGLIIKNGVAVSS